MSSYNLVYRWKRVPRLKGMRCRLIARGKFNSRLVEFEDGEKHVVSGNALRRAERS